MKTTKKTLQIGIVCLVLLTACGIPKVSQRNVQNNTPDQFSGIADTNAISKQTWRDFFADPYLIALIDTALANNQELNIILQEINMAKNEISAKQGELLPLLNIGAGAGVEKTPRYTREGAVESNIEIDPGEENPEPLPDFNVAFTASWEVDIWRKLRNSRDAASARYLASIEGQNFMKTLLIEEVASSYYELLSLDLQLQIIEDYIVIQSNALKTVKLQKQAGDATELAVQKFEAEVLSTKSLQFEIKQEVVEVENKINFLLGRYPQPIQRNDAIFLSDLPANLSAGIPSQLLENRPDIRQAEYEILAANLDIKVAKAQFYPSLDISAGLGLRAFNPAFLIQTPESILYGLAGDIVAPLINRKAIKANYINANSKQIQTVFNYEKTVLNAYLEVYNQVSKMDNLKKAYTLKSQEVAVLDRAILTAGDLFRSARADYMEVLLTQRDALDTKIEQIELRKMQFLSMVNLYKACGGGWK